MIPFTYPEECLDCGRGMVRLTAKEGRTRRVRGCGRMEIPHDFLIPTCDTCGVETVDTDTARLLSALGVG